MSRKDRKAVGYRIDGRIWLEKDGELYLGWGRIMLLERIKEHGSMAAAARSMQLAYRNAWLWVNSMNRLAPSPLVVKRIGGGTGGYSKVTEEGEKAITEYKKLRGEFKRFIEDAA